MQVVLQATVCDCLALDPFAFEEDGLSAPEVDVSWGKIVEALVIAGARRLLHRTHPEWHGPYADRLVHADGLAWGAAPTGHHGRPDLLPPSHRSELNRWPSRCREISSWIAARGLLARTRPPSAEQLPFAPEEHRHHLGAGDVVADRNDVVVAHEAVANAR